MLQDFSNKVADMRQDIKNQGGKYSQDQIDKASKLQEKINDAHAQEHEYVEKQNTANQAKYQKEKVKYEQKLKTELAKQEEQRKTETQQKKDQVKASLLTDERIAHSPVLKATEEPLSIEGIEGRSSEQNHAHEHGHMMAAAAEGLEPTQFISDQHPDAKEDGTAAAVYIDTSMAEKGPKGVAQKVIATLGGPAYDETHFNIKMSKNFGARSDIARARQLLREDGGLRGAALEKVFDALYDRAKEHVSNPEALAIAQANLRVREAGLDPRYHMSAGRVAEYVKKLQGVYGNVKTSNTEVLHKGDIGGGDEEGESDLAGGAGREQAGAAKGVRAEALRESGEGGGRESRGLAKAAISKTKPIDASNAAKALEEKFGTTDDYADTAFMMPDGKKITAAKMHDAMLRDVGYEQEGDTADSIRSRFINDAKAVRVRYGMERGGNTLHLSVPKSGVTSEQIREMKGAANMMGRNGNIVMERADVSPGTKDALSKVKEFGTANDIEPMLREIGAHPESSKGGSEKASLKKSAVEPGIPPERSTGVKEYDDAIREGGAIPGGIQKGDAEAGLPDMALFHDPTSGSTLALPTTPWSKWPGLSKEAVIDQLKKSREVYAAAARRTPTEASSETVAEHANAFNKSTGRPEVDATPVQHSPETASRIARAYEAMPHNPADPAVQKAYNAMKNDLDAQWDYATGPMGMKFEPWNKSGQPYADSKEMMADVKNNKHLYFFQGGELPADHPMAAIDPKTGFSYNDKMRAVHDLFGHAAHGFQFGPKGEENAWNVHRQMFSPEAVPAVTTETRGQNSWVNFGDHLRNAEGKIPGKGEPGYVPPAERPYSQNKAGLLPEEFHGQKEPEPEGPKGGKAERRIGQKA